MNQFEGSAKHDKTHPHHSHHSHHSHKRSITMNSINKTARFAGLLYLILAVVSAFGLLYVPSVILVPGDSAATATNIVASESLFRLGFVGNLLAFTINIFVVVLLSIPSPSQGLTVQSGSG